MRLATLRAPHENSTAQHSTAQHQRNAGDGRVCMPPRAAKTLKARRVQAISSRAGTEESYTLSSDQLHSSHCL